MSENPTTYFRDFTWLDLMLTHDPQHYEDEDVYEFSGNRKFKSTDKTDSGVYDGT